MINYDLLVDDYYARLVEEHYKEPVDYDAEFDYHADDGDDER